MCITFGLFTTNKLVDTEKLYIFVPALF